jgi:predicted dehydrogenase
MVIAAVALAPAEPGQPGENLSRFDTAAGVTPDTRRYADYRDLLAAGAGGEIDAVQVCVRPHRTAAVVADCLRAGIPVMADKPLAMDERQLGDLWRAHRETGTFILPTHMYRRLHSFALVANLARAGEAGEIVAGHCQISFRWGASRPAWYASRETFPGTFAFIGVHAVDTVLWALGDRFASAAGHQSTAPHPEYPACASLAYALVTLDNGGTLALSADFLRPMGAATHGDVRLRLAGTIATLDATETGEPAVHVVDAKRDDVLPAPDAPYWYTTFVQHVLGQGAAFMTTREAFRVAEVSLRIQRALDTGDTVDLRPTQIA